MDDNTDWTLPQDLKQATADRQRDVLDWIKSEFSDWQGHINDLLRFYMETSQIREMDFNPGAFEPGEMAEPHPNMELTL